MKNQFKLYITCFLLFFAISEGIAQGSNNDVSFGNKNILSSGYYVVIGAYSPRKENYAKLYTERVKKLGFEPSYGLSRKKRLLFVYLTYTGNFREALDEMRAARKNQEFHDAWVFVSTDVSTDKLLTDSDGNRDTSDVDKMDDKKSKDLDSNKKLLTDADSANDSEAGKDVSTAGDDKDVPDAGDKISEATMDVEVAETSSEDKGSSAVIKTLSDANVFFNLYNARNLEGVEGDVQIIDMERSKLMGAVKAGDSLELKDPNNGSGDLTFLCDVFGFRRAQMEMNYYDPLADTTNSDISLSGNTFMVNFELIRYHKGDIATLYNVYFFRDAALMEPRSKYEVGQLLEMMKENSNYRIKIHGHVNGRHAGKIISKGDGEEFFALAPGNKEGFGTAKELSLKRAELIRDYLINNGIAADRMEIKAWGGKLMLHDKHSSKARRNVRVEIEILQD